MGKCINNSDLDQAFAELEWYGPATAEQINNGNHMKRSFEENTTLNVALSCMYMESFISIPPLIEKELWEGLANAAVVTEKL